jgi:hypothetical protein
MKYFLINILILSISFVQGAGAQECNPSNPLFKRKILVVQKQANNFDKISDTSSFLGITFSYDFSDSVSICIKGKVVLSTVLSYSIPDSNTSLYPNNRTFVRLKELPRGKKCKIIFWWSKYYATFLLKGKTGFLNFELRRQENKWRLFTSNVLPWPD